MIKNNIIPDVNPGDIVGDSPTFSTNATNLIKYNDDYSWVNGSTEEAVYDLDKETQIGTLDPRERAVVLYKVDGMTAVAYDTGKGKH